MIEQSVGEFLGERGIAKHDRGNRMVLTGDGEAGLGHGIAEVGGVVLHAVGEFGGGFEHLKDLERSGDDGRGDCVREQIGPRALAEQLDDLLFAGGVTAGGAAQRLAERAGGEVDFAEQPAVLVGAAAARAEETGGVAIVEMHHRLVFRGQRMDLVELGDDAVHREHAVGGDKFEARAGGVGFLQFGFQVGHVVVGIAEAHGFAEAHAVDDRGVVERVGDDGVLLA